uniref:Uncharacterized protein n=1 Tax=Anguilla anguilla TaxID=7936 RepID=A0A0E9WZE9_ANGAN
MLRNGCKRGTINPSAAPRRFRTSSSRRCRTTVLTPVPTEHLSYICGSAAASYASAYTRAYISDCASACVSDFLIHVNRPSKRTPVVRKVQVHRCSRSTVSVSLSCIVVICFLVLIDPPGPGICQIQAKKLLF